MSRGLLAGCLAVLVLLPARGGRCDDDDQDSRLGLADLAAYRSALSGKATAADVPAGEPVRPVGFRDLWDHPETWKGHRVQVRGKVVRIFHQDAIGRFPTLVEAWLTTPQGDLFCTVFPAGTSPEIGQDVTFRGTFLRTVRYAGDDQPRLAPCIVGDGPPGSVSVTRPPGDPAADSLRAIGGSPGADPAWNARAESWSPVGWMVGIALGLAGAGVLAWHHLRRPLDVRPPGTRHKNAGPAAADPPLVFLEPEPVNGTALPDTRSH